MLSSLLLLHLVLGACVDGTTSSCTLAGCAIAKRTCDYGRFGPCECWVVSCDDGNPCTIDSAGTDTCSHTPVAAGTQCNDGNACTYGDHCNGAGSCVGTAIACTSDPGPCGAVRSCNGTSSCSVSYPGSSTSCNDNDACTYGDHCNGNGWCVGTAIACASDTCAQRACNGTSSCTVVMTFAPCDDGNVCTYGDTCDATGQCAGTPVTCLPAGPCQTSVCNGTATCTVTTVGRGTPCSEGPACGGFCDGISLRCQPAE